MKHKTIRASLEDAYKLITTRVKSETINRRSLFFEHELKMVRFSVLIDVAGLSAQHSSDQDYVQ